MNHINHLAAAIQAVVDAGKAILDVYHSDFQVEYKEDESPLTLADKKAHDIISTHLAMFDIPLLSEEGKAIPLRKAKYLPLLEQGTPCKTPLPLTGHLPLSGEFSRRIREVADVRNSPL